MGLPQFPQIVEQRHRVRAGIEYVAVRLEGDLKCGTIAGARLGRLGPVCQRSIGYRQQSRERAGYFHLSRDGFSFRLLLEDQPDDVAGLEPAVDQTRA